MAFGPGKYDLVCTAARLAAEALGVILIVIEGKEGNGFAVQLHPDLLKDGTLPKVLRRVADGIEADLDKKLN